MVSSYAPAPLVDGDRVIAQGIVLNDDDPMMVYVIDTYVSLPRHAPGRFQVIGGHNADRGKESPYTQLHQDASGIGAMIFLEGVMHEPATMELFERYVHTMEDMREITSNVSFKNSIMDWKWEFHCGEARMDSEIGYALWCSFERPDIHSGAVGRGSGRKHFVPRHQTESYVFFTCHIAMELVIRHEFLEGQNYQGVQPLYPHRSVLDLCNLAKSPRTWIRPGD